MRAAIASLKVIDDLPMPPGVAWSPDMDMLDWLGSFFGFQVYTLNTYFGEVYCFCADFLLLFKSAKF